MPSAVVSQTITPQAAFSLGRNTFQVSAEAITGIFDGASYDSLLFLPVAPVVSFATLFFRLVAAIFLGCRGAALPTQENAREPGLWAAARYYIDTRGGNLLLFYRALQFLNSAALLAITLFCRVRESDDVIHKAPLTAAFYASITYVYTFFLTLFSLLATKRWSRIANQHASTIFFLTFGVFAYRDLYPLTTFNSQPKDLHEGRTLWYKLALLFLNGIVIPGLIPREYVPFDPKTPSSEINPEQTASIFSSITYSYMDPIVFLAYRVPHLSHNQLPPLADYDHAYNLKSSSFKYLDIFSGAKKRYIFWNIMRVFRLQYLLMALMVVFWVIASFISPFAINGLLRYLETGGHDATHKPWVWILCLFLGPLIVSFFYQGYIFFATRAMVRFEAIATQLIFEHALRIRVKAETDSNEDKTPAVSTEVTTTSSTSDCTLEPENASQHSQEVTATAVRTESTVQPSTSSVTTGSTKDLKNSQKAGSPSTTKANNLVGRINNLVTTDMAIVTGARDLMLVLVYAPLQITLCILFLYKILGWSAFVGLATMIMLFPIPGVIAQKINQVQKSRLQRTDARVQEVTETMNMLRMVKLFGWEKKMAERLAEKREEELVWLWKRQILDLITGNVNYVIPLLVMISTYASYTVIMKQELRASIVFSSMTVFDLLREQLFMAFYMFNNIVSGKVSLDRIDEFLQTTELLDPFVEKKEEDVVFPQPNEDGEEKIGFNNASFTWSAESDGALTPSKRTFTLMIDGELTFKPNGLNLIVGPTGSGKTSILMALLGEMHYVPLGPSSWFNLPRSGGVSYAAQESWVQNETIRENILFGYGYDEKRYKEVLYQCGLERDLELFEAGDQTEVGEKGLTLSGGQKARITLARAIYSPAKTILLDDVLAALDVHTAKWVVDKCLAGDLLKDRTVILVTHNIAMTRGIAEFAVSVDVDGKIVAQGTMEEVLGKDKVIAQELQEDREVLEKDDEVVDQPTAPVRKDGKLIVAEEMQDGHIKWKSFKLFLVALGGSHPGLFFLILIGGLGVVEFINAFQTWFLGHWASQYEHRPSSEVSVPIYLGSYVGLLTIAVTFYMSIFIVYIYGVIRASRKIHRELLASILGTTLRWLDTTPASRIITRCTQDIRAVDDPIKDYLKWLTELTMSMLVKFAAVVFMTPIFVIPGFIVAMLGGWIGQIYMAAQLSVKRELSNAKAPVVGHFGAAIAGLTSIRAYGAQEAFINKSQERINRSSRAGRAFYNLNRWVCIRIDFISGSFSAGLAFYLVYFQNHTAANIGFSLNMAVGFSAMILWWIRSFNEFEVQGNSLERIQNYIDIEQEAPATPTGEPPAYWPTSGTLIVKHLSAKYSPDGPKVLEDISFELKGGERLGIVGRTGSGKSSLTLALLRCIFTEGEVFYDGLRTDTLNLDALRSSITIIPQIPELLSGTLRTNLDPFDQYDDGILNDALHAAGLFTLQADMDEGRITLDSNISSGGGNLSVGQRQILALARAIVRGSKLLILDEATSAIDHRTDTAIQTSLRSELGCDTTVITVAHRLQTIMDADKIMVLDAGRIVEFDSPSKLLKKEKGFLRALVDESGDKENLYSMAKGKI